MRKILSVFTLLILLFGCTSKKTFQVVIEKNNSNYDTLYIQERITDRILARVPLNQLNVEHEFSIKDATLADLIIKSSDATYPAIIRPGTKKIIAIDSNTVKTLQSIPDSLANYLLKSFNKVLNDYGDLIFGQDNPDRIIYVFDSLAHSRGEQINKFKSELTSEEAGILDYQNKAQSYSFLMFYGRMIKEYAPDNSFFNFTEKIDNENIYSKTLPNITLYKFEIQFLNEQDSIPSADSFLTFIETQTRNEDLQDFLKAIYLKGVIEKPEYWKKHRNLFTATSIKDALQRESKNKYTDLIAGAAASFYSSQKGVKGFDFSATKMDGTELKLSSLAGKVVIIDTWATWCGPCISERPRMLAIAKKYKDNPNVAVLMVSVDNAVDKWQNYVKRTNEDGYGIEISIVDGMNKEFGKQYLIKAIPKYIILDKNGVIIDSTIPQPSAEMEQLIDKELEVIGQLEN